MGMNKLLLNLCALALGAQTGLALALPTISIDVQNVPDARSTLPVTIRLSEPSALAVTGQFSATQPFTESNIRFDATGGKECKNGVDFIEKIRQSFRIEPGQVSISLPVQLCPDNVVETDEHIRLQIHTDSLSGAQCGTGLQADCVATPQLIDSGASATISALQVFDLTVQEPPTGIVNARVRVRLNRIGANDLRGATIRFRTEEAPVEPNGGFQLPPPPLGIGPDCAGNWFGTRYRREFLPRSGTVTIPARDPNAGALDGTNEAFIDIPICADNVRETAPTEFYVVIESDDQAISRGRARVRITDFSPVRTVTLVGDSSVREPSSSRVSASANMTVSLLGGPRAVDTTVLFNTKDGTATGSITNLFCDRDFRRANGQVIIPAGEVSADFSIQICPDNLIELEERFQVEIDTLATDPNVTLDRFYIPKTVRIIDADSAAVGVFQFAQSSDRPVAGEVQNFRVTWNLPEPQVWRNLNTIEMRIRDDENTSLWVLWQEQENTFSVCRKLKGQSIAKADKSDNDGDDEFATRSGIPAHGCSAGYPPGTQRVLETKYARLHLANTTVVGSGPTGRSVILNIGVSFKDRAHGEQTIELAASNDMRESDKFVEASSLRVVRGK
jgi:Calx-beta domain